MDRADQHNRSARAAMELLEAAYALEGDAEDRHALIAGAALPRTTRRLALDLLALDAAAGEAFEPASRP